MAVFLNDPFTDTDGTLLESHTAGGYTWAKHGGWTGSAVVQSNRIYAGNGIESHYKSSGVPASANYDVTVTVFDVSNLSLTLVGAMGRMLPGVDTAYTAFVILNGSTFILLKRHLNGTGTDLANTTIPTPTVGTSHTLTLRMSGSSLYALWDGVVILGPITDTNITAAGTAGIINNGVGSSTTGWHIDSVTATDPVGLSNGGAYRFTYAPSNTVVMDFPTGNLMLGGKRLRVAGANTTGLGAVNYSSMYGASVDGEGYHFASHSEIDDVLNQAQAMSAMVFRCYGSVMSVGRLSAVQPVLGAFNAAALEPVDYMLQQCAIRGVKVWFPLVDAYDFQPRGAPWYCTVNGVSPDGNASQFYDPANIAIVNSFKTHISYVLNHVNQYTGVVYKNDPTILCWETGNELHNGVSGGNAATRAWTDQISRHIKVTESALQLVMDGMAFISTGVDDGGFRNADLPYIDIVTNHPYYSGALPQVVASGPGAHSFQKAYIVGEYTWTDLNPGGTGNDWTLVQLLSAIETSNTIDGDAYWQLLPLLVGVGGPSIFGLHYPGDNADMADRGIKLARHAQIIAGTQNYTNFLPMF
jgi:mannan endo-1,4-beta-mannosidase